MIPIPHHPGHRVTRRVTSRLIHKHWHHFTALIGLGTALALLLAGAGLDHLARGGFRAGPLPPQLVAAGAPLPSSWSLAHYLVRVHNQGDSNSCVGQTLATITEIQNREFALQHSHFRKSHPFFGPQTPFSSGYIWNQAAQGQNTGITYQAAFSILAYQGDAPLATFSPDGATQWDTQPGPYARSFALQHRIRGWRSIDPADRYTIESQIHAGRPIAIALPIRDSIYQHWDGSWPVIYSDNGNYWFNHSLTIIGYNPTGVTVLNSWGPAWGYHGKATFSWGMIAAAQPELVTQSPLYPKTPTRSHRTTRPKRLRRYHRPKQSLGNPLGIPARKHGKANTHHKKRRTNQARRGDTEALTRKVTGSPVHIHKTQTPVRP